MIVTDVMCDSVRGVLQAIRLNPGVTFGAVYKHCESRGDDMSGWPEWTGYTRKEYVTEHSAARLIFEIMIRKAPMLSDLLQAQAEIKALRRNIANSHSKACEGLRLEACSLEQGGVTDENGRGRST